MSRFDGQNDGRFVDAMLDESPEDIVMVLLTEVNYRTSQAVLLGLAKWYGSPDRDGRYEEVAKEATKLLNPPKVTRYRFEGPGGMKGTVELACEPHKHFEDFPGDWEWQPDEG
jgi:hypothetical protein